MIDLKDRVALVTGGSRGIGKAIAIKLASFGANVAINYTSREEEALKTKEEIEKHGVKAFVIKCDVSNFEDAQNMIDEVINEFGKIDVLVNNAGITKDTLLMKMKEEDFDKVISVNLKGVFNCTKAVTRPMMKKKYGKIINMASVVGIIGNPGQANYCASKAGVIGFTKATARELASRNITINAIAPGFIETEMTKVLKDDVKEAYESSIPMRKFGKPEDIANLVAFLSSDMSSYITGQVINVDGGMVMQ
ncbi:3-oxoacyl-[acyl-carrier-protein] reductase [Tepidibacter formicigenes]|jgi:3-oxoacyl-[acyl-carrier protein] reductase|uniref:3-oxoacyl-[acyl-carrier-protein] reductase n=1 Tax=Tepidibacter formicigenes DSM 15518 TaxID=1123349 RepID=A0A1M6L3U3_9FIRM|nr:3-oxoacyl-[acyl-carrier-protein] reductase [Tepidibacter formicigenes]SHJ65888.1 3-oxoacyl-[acyl-carrier-protein] reductase [Tepidibacter formicigenes DSM 15518]